MKNVIRKDGAPGGCDCGDPSCPGMMVSGVFIDVRGYPAGTAPIELSWSGGGGDGKRALSDPQPYPSMGLPKWAWHALMQALAARPVVPLKGMGHVVSADKNFCVVCGMTDMQILATGDVECSGGDGVQTPKDAVAPRDGRGGNVWGGKGSGLDSAVAGGMGRDGAMAGAGTAEKNAMLGAISDTVKDEGIDLAIADAILALINRMPTTPSRDQIAAAVRSIRYTGETAPVERKTFCIAKET